MGWFTIAPRRHWLRLALLGISMSVALARTGYAENSAAPDLRLTGAVLYSYSDTGSVAPKVGTLQLPGRGTKLLVYGTLAVVAMEGGRVLLVGARTATRLRVIAELELGDELADLTISEGMLRLISVSGARQNVPLGALEQRFEQQEPRTTSCHAEVLKEGDTHLKIIQDRLQVTTFESGGVITCEEVRLPLVGRSTAVRNRVAYVALEPSGVAVIDLSVPGAPRFDRVTEPSRRIESFRFVDDRLYMIDANLRISIHPLSELQPRPLDSVLRLTVQRRTPASAPDARTSDPSSAKLLTSTETDRHTYELQDSALIRRSRDSSGTETVTILLLPNKGAGVASYGSIAIVALRPEGLLVVDTSDPHRMKIVETQQSLRVLSLRLIGDSLYIRTTSERLEVVSMMKLHCYFDLKMEEQSGAPIAESSKAGTGLHDARIAFEQRKEQLLVIREVASIPKECTSVRLPSSSGQVAARSGVAYVTLLEGGLSIIEAADSLHPRLVATVEAGRVFSDPQVQGDSLWLRDRSSNRYRYSLQKPLQPKLEQVVALTNRSPAIEVDGTSLSRSAAKETQKGAGMLLTFIGGLGLVSGIGIVVAGGVVGFGTLVISDPLSGMKTTHGTDLAKTGGLVAGVSLPVVAVGVALWVTGAVSK